MNAEEKLIRYIASKLIQKKFFLRKGFLPDEINENFCYVGTFFWIRLDKLVDKIFDPNSKFYLEGLPGLVCELSESYNHGPELTPLEGPYELETWNKKGIYNGFPNKN